MKKILLSALALGSLCSVMAQTEATDDTYNYWEKPQVIAGARLLNMSPNGVYAVSDYYGSIVIANMETGETDPYEQDEDYIYYYSVGLGNCVANNGTVAGGQTAEGDASVYMNGEWSFLPVNEELDKVHLETLANAITPDGTRIVGTVGRGAIDYNSDDDTQMAFPVVWNLGEDGKWQMYEELPAPARDIFNRVPQRVTAVYISADGNTIAGQILDATGMFIMPIMWTLDDEGKWAYSIPCEDLYHLDIEIPEMPGDAPSAPDPADYMTEEEKAAYQEAYNAYWNDNTGTVAYPDQKDFMSEEEKAAYLEAYSEYLAAYEAWEEKYYAYLDATDQYIASCPNLIQNSVLLSPNAKYYVSDIQDPNGAVWSWPPITMPVYFNLEENEYVKMDNNYGITTVTDEGQMIAYALVTGADTRTSYFSSDLGATWVPLQEWVQTQNEAVYDFMNENMRHSYEEYNWDTDAWDTFNDVWMCGTVHATPDLKRLISYNYNCWDMDETAPLYYSYILPMDYESAGLRQPVMSDLIVRSEGNGIISLNGEFNSLTVYDTMGRLMFNANNPASTINTGLRSGLYMVKAVGADGRVTVLKAAF